jgi:hypothetical protein
MLTEIREPVHPTSIPSSVRSRVIRLIVTRPGEEVGVLSYIPRKIVSYCIIIRSTSECTPCTRSSCS